MSAVQPSLFLSHGGGPWPWVPGLRDRHATLEAAFRALPASLPEPPRAVLMISGHWEAESFRIQHNRAPGMVYDYAGFPAQTYQLRYPAPGCPALAERVAQRLAAAGLPTVLDQQRGYDHGAFVPMAVAWPKADMPLVQASLRHGYEVDEHLALGRALAPLRRDGVLIIGSGLSYHNLRDFGPRAAVPSAAFDTWLGDMLALPAADRLVELARWDQAPGARESHPQADHLAPLFVALGAAETDPAHRLHHDRAFLGGVTVSSFRFG